MKTPACRLLSAVALALATLTAPAQGPLAPPGPPAETMKTLDQIEPRTPISEWGATIDQSGAYYLTANLTADGASSGITIAASDVTLDLNGFAIVGAPGSGPGITLARFSHNVAVRNGTIRGCPGAAVDAAMADRCTFETLRLSENGGAADAALVTGGRARVARCVFAANGGTGVRLQSGSDLRACTVSGNEHGGVEALDDCVIDDNLISDNGAAGVVLSGNNNRLSANTLLGNQIGLRILGAANHVRGNRVSRSAVANYEIAQDITHPNHLNLLLCEVPERLSWPCSVTFAGTLVCVQDNTNGITVAADNVTIDLAGHALLGPGSNSGHGISQSASYRNLRVLNGTVSNWQGDGRAGVYALGQGVQLGTLRASSNCDGLVTGADSIVKDCQALDNASRGLRTGTSSTLSDCIANRNGTGFDANWNSTLTACVANGNDGDGFEISSSSILSRCASEGNARYGFDVVNGCILNACTATGNTLVGFYTQEGCTLHACVAMLNGAEGISVSRISLLSACLANGNSVGIRAGGNQNRIEGNETSGNATGFLVAGSGNFISRNTARGNTTNWNIVAGNVCLVVQATAAGAISGNAGGTAPGSTDPNANFTY